MQAILLKPHYYIWTYYIFTLSISQIKVCYLFLLARHQILLTSCARKQDEVYDKALEAIQVWNLLWSLQNPFKKTVLMEFIYINLAQVVKSWRVHKSPNFNKMNSTPKIGQKKKKGHQDIYGTFPFNCRDL